MLFAIICWKSDIDFFLQVLYLPSLWYHCVTQKIITSEEPVVAVNFWYDMALTARLPMPDFVKDWQALPYEH